MGRRSVADKPLHRTTRHQHQRDRVSSHRNTHAATPLAACAAAAQPHDSLLAALFT